MSEEVLIPKMKRLDKKQTKLKIPINNFIMVIFCTLLITVSTFINLDIKHYILPQGFTFDKSFPPESFIYSFSIIPQIPVLMLVCSILGKKLAITCSCLYLITGLFIFPVFALGGGIGYAGEYSFGYLLAYIPAAYICGCFLSKKYSIINMLLATILGVLTIHLFGITYMVILALIKQEGKTFITSWIQAQSGLKILYDMVLGFVGIIIGKYIHSFSKFLSE